MFVDILTDKKYYKAKSGRIQLILSIFCHFLVNFDEAISLYAFGSLKELFKDTILLNTGAPSLES